MLTRRQVVLGAAGLAALAVTSRVPATGTLAAADQYITTARLRLRTGPGLGYTVIEVIPEGVYVALAEWAGEADGYTWAKVWYHPNQSGYVAAEFLSPGGDFAIGTTVHVDTGTGERANLRSGPGISYRVIMPVIVGTNGTVQSGETQADGYAWIKVAIAGTTGWMATSVLAAGPSDASDQVLHQYVKVVDGPLRLRAAPGLGSPVITLLPTGASGQVTGGGPVDVDGYTWVKVNFSTPYPVNGWVAWAYMGYA
jgi:uncharacterized protein YraI